MNALAAFEVKAAILNMVRHGDSAEYVARFLRDLIDCEDSFAAAVAVSQEIENAAIGDCFAAEVFTILAN